MGLRAGMASVVLSMLCRMAVSCDPSPACQLCIQMGIQRLQYLRKYGVLCLKVYI